MEQEVEYAEEGKLRDKQVEAGERMEFGLDQGGFLIIVIQRSAFKFLLLFTRLCLQFSYVLRSSTPYLVLTGKQVTIVEKKIVHTS